jgi:hypothetical protein
MISRNSDEVTSAGMTEIYPQQVHGGFAGRVLEELPCGLGKMQDVVGAVDDQRGWGESLKQLEVEFSPRHAARGNRRRGARELNRQPGVRSGS